MAINHGLNGRTGKCTKCGRSARKGPICRKCHEVKSKKAARRAAKLTAANKCCRCSRDVDTANERYGYSFSKAHEFLICPVCFFKTVAAHNLGKSSRYTEIMGLFEAQGRKCACTGEPLILCSTASLDHIVPRSRGGDDSLGNLRWVLKAVNIAKHDLTHEEFLSLCRRVLEGAARDAEDHYRAAAFEQRTA